MWRMALSMSCMFASREISVMVRDMSLTFWGSSHRRLLILWCHNQLSSMCVGTRRIWLKMWTRPSLRLFNKKKVGFPLFVKTNATMTVIWPFQMHWECAELQRPCPIGSLAWSYCVSHSPCHATLQSSRRVFDHMVCFSHLIQGLRSANFIYQEGRTTPR